MIPVLLSGGEGKRLWPVSRPGLPKQFCRIFGESLQKQTLNRVKSLGSPWTVATESIKELVTQLNEELKLPHQQSLFEPMPKNTAPAIAFTCATLKARGFDKEIVAVFPADHLIENQETFLRACQLAEKVAKQNHIVTFGIKPTYPSTGYGYIEVGSERAESLGTLHAFRAQRFHEKPNFDIAKQFFADSHFLWNSGIFVFQVSTMIAAFEQHLPKLWEAFEGLKKDFSNLESIYSRVTPESIDYGIMEKAQNIFCIPCDFGWSDVGSWDEIARLKMHEPLPPNTFTDHAGNFIIKAGQRKHVLIGVQDLIVVDTEEGLLICKKGDSEKIKKSLDTLEKTRV